ncbi:MAG: GWxTD domain-containing protein, partial [Bacteroidetes bacterium]|nr:GWxTD domain-containing protein [Bacteroidota bacterium]
RKDSWNFFAERLREMRRIELAKDILELDPDNAFAHEELGSVYIRDFWRYRNALMLPLYAFKYVGIDEGAGRFDYEAQNVGVREGFMPSAADRGLGRFENPNRVFLNDQFDLDALQSQGVPVQDLSVRAQRAYEEAIGHLQQALESDPRRRPVYDDLMEIYALKGEYEAALEMVEDMYRFFPEDAQTWTYLGLAHYHLGNMEAAARSFETALQYMDEGERSAYQDIGFLLTDEERDVYAQDSVAYLARFWASKDPRYLTTYNERRLEHFARLTYADLLYGAPDLDLRGWETQRGSILVRYGQPDSDVTITPNDQSYREGKTVVAAAVFRPPQDNEGNVGGAEVRNNPEQLNEMMESRLFQEMNTFNIWEYGDFRFVFEDPFRNGEFRLYSPKASAIGDGQQAWLNDYQIRAKQTFRETPEQYEYEAPGRQIELPYLTTAFKGAEGQTDLYVHYGVPINEYDGSQEMLEITANTGTFLVSDQRDILVERRNTIYGLPTAQIVSFPDVNLWVDTQVMEAPPGTHDLSVEFETASGNTVAVQRRAVDVPDFEAEAPGLSDLLLAYRVEESLDGEPLGPSEIVRDGLSIQPAPWSVFRVDQPVYVYFETYNLDRNPEGQTDYTVDVLLVPKDDASGIAKLFKNLFGGDKGVSFSFPGTSTSPDVSNYQIVDVSDQEPGVYTLAVRVRDNISGQTVESEQELFLEE